MEARILYKNGMAEKMLCKTIRISYPYIQMYEVSENIIYPTVGAKGEESETTFTGISLETVTHILIQE